MHVLGSYLGFGSGTMHFLTPLAVYHLMAVIMHWHASLYSWDQPVYQHTLIQPLIFMRWMADYKSAHIHWVSSEFISWNTDPASGFRVWHPGQLESGLANRDQYWMCLRVGLNGSYPSFWIKWSFLLNISRGWWCRRIPDHFSQFSSFQWRRTLFFF